MGFLDRFRKKKEKKAEAEKVVTELELLCADDTEVYEALSNTMLLDPRKVEYSIEDVVKKAEEHEKANDRINALFWYKIAGGLAIYKGDVREVKRYFGKVAKLDPKFDAKILKLAEKAVKKAREYYERYLPPETT